MIRSNKKIENYLYSASILTKNYYFTAFLKKFLTKMALWKWSKYYDYCVVHSRVNAPLSCTPSGVQQCTKRGNFPTLQLLSKNGNKLFILRENARLVLRMTFRAIVADFFKNYFCWTTTTFVWNVFWFYCLFVCSGRELSMTGKWVLKAFKLRWFFVFL